MLLISSLVCCAILLLVFGFGVLVWDMLWYGNHQWDLSKSRLLRCPKCEHVFLLERQQTDRRCPLCGTRAANFRMPYTGVRETVRQRARNLKQ
ncbi:MAG: hypothetical protein IKO65_01715 [Victivallales bacterium]|nr:hypothetical protein [Victivallales bacterium]